jgi:hypothetical protein
MGHCPLDGCNQTVILNINMTEQRRVDITKATPKSLRHVYFIPFHHNRNQANQLNKANDESNDTEAHHLLLSTQ